MIEIGATVRNDYGYVSDRSYEYTEPRSKEQ